jgi:hypothetical protein
MYARPLSALETSMLESWNFPRAYDDHEISGISRPDSDAFALDENGVLVGFDLTASDAKLRVLEPIESDFDFWLGLGFDFARKGIVNKFAVVVLK